MYTAECKVFFMDIIKREASSVLMMRHRGEEREKNHVVKSFTLGR